MLQPSYPDIGERTFITHLQVVLNGGQHWAMTARDGSFTFRHVSPGVYLLEVLSTTHHYSSLKIKLDDQGGLIVVEYKVGETADGCKAVT